jgi:hypothetical protein
MNFKSEGKKIENTGGGYFINFSRGRRIDIQLGTVCQCKSFFSSPRDTGPVPESTVNSRDVSRVNSDDEDTRFVKIVC